MRRLKNSRNLPHALLVSMPLDHWEGQQTLVTRSTFSLLVWATHLPRSSHTTWHKDLSWIKPKCSRELNILVTHSLGVEILRPYLQGELCLWYYVIGELGYIFTKDTWCRLSMATKETSKKHFSTLSLKRISSIGKARDSPRIKSVSWPSTFISLLPRSSGTSIGLKTFDSYHLNKF